MFGLNIDPRNPHGNPDPVKLRGLGVETVRFIFKDPTASSQPDRDVARFYRQRVEALAKAGLDALVILNAETYPRLPAAGATDEVWDEFVTGFAQRAAEIANVLAPWQPSFQIWRFCITIHSLYRSLKTIRIPGKSISSRQIEPANTTFKCAADTRRACPKMLNRV